VNLKKIFANGPYIKLGWDGTYNIEVKPSLKSNAKKETDLNDERAK